MASVLSADGFRFLFRTDQGRIDRQVWWLGLAQIAVVALVLTLGWQALSPYAHRTLDERRFFDAMTLVAYVYLTLYAFALLLMAVCYVNLSAKRLRDAAKPSSLAGLAPLALFLAASLHWLQPRVADVFPFALLLIFDAIAAAVVLWQIYLLGVAAGHDR